MPSLKKDFLTTRNQTEFLCKPLAIEDYVIQSMTDVSPPKWHLAHTTWFFDRFILKTFQKDYRPFNERYHFIFNSYYQTLGKPYVRERRGLLSRPTVAEILEYRHYLNEKMIELFEEEERTKFRSSFQVHAVGPRTSNENQTIFSMANT